MLIEVLRNGRRQRVHPKIGQILMRKQVVRELDEKSTDRRDELFADPAEELVPDVAADVVAAGEEVEQADKPNIDEMDRESLLKLADELGLKVHGRSGEEKIREIIREHLK